jgi:hypothetical protein
VLETVKKEEEKQPKRLGSVQLKLNSVWHTELSGGAPDSVRCARLVSGEKAALEIRSAAYGYNSPDCPVSQRLPVHWLVAQSVGDAWPAPTVGRGTGLSGAPSGLKLQRSTVPYLEGNRAPDSYNDCPVMHQTARCTTRQKTRLAFQDCLQRLLAALGL